MTARSSSSTAEASTASSFRSVNLCCETWVYFCRKNMWERATDFVDARRIRVPLNFELPTALRCVLTLTLLRRGLLLLLLLLFRALCPNLANIGPPRGEGGEEEEPRACC